MLLTNIQTEHNVARKHVRGAVVGALETVIASSNADSNDTSVSDDSDGDDNDGERDVTALTGCVRVPCFILLRM